MVDHRHCRRLSPLSTPIEFSIHLNAQRPIPSILGSPLPPPLPFLFLFLFLNRLIMHRNDEDQKQQPQHVLHGGSKEVEEVAELEVPHPESPIRNGRPSSMVIKKAKSVIPAHLVAEAISSLDGLDLRWSGPITPTEMQYVEEYVLAKYPQYCNGLVDGEDTNFLCVSTVDSSAKQKPAESSSNCTTTSVVAIRESSSPSFSINSLTDLDKTQLEPSRLLEILTKKSSSPRNFISIPEIQATNRALQHCGVSEGEYMVLFTPSYKEAMMMVGESYPFFRGNFYMTVVGEDRDYIRQFAMGKDSKVVAAPETWLDLRIKGSQLSQYFRRKCKSVPKGLFAYPANVNRTRYSMHWISEAHRNSWHVLLDATEEDRLTLTLHRPDFVLCTLHNKQTQPSVITCLLVRTKSFDTS